MIRLVLYLCVGVSGPSRWSDLVTSLAGSSGGQEAGGAGASPAVWAGAPETQQHSTWAWPGALVVAKEGCGLDSGSCGWK